MDPRIILPMAFFVKRVMREVFIEKKSMHKITRNVNFEKFLSNHSGQVDSGFFLPSCLGGYRGSFFGPQVGNIHLVGREIFV